jgi:hypothetical protein
MIHGFSHFLIVAIFEFLSSLKLNAHFVRSVFKFDQILILPQHIYTDVLDVYLRDTLFKNNQNNFFYPILLAFFGSAQANR